MAMPLLFLERLEEKEMPTLQEIKDQVDNLRQQLAIFDGFDEEIKKTQEEVEHIKAKKAEMQTFEDFKAINSKEKYIADLREQKKKLECERVGDIATKAVGLSVTPYFKNGLEQDKIIKNQRQEIKQKSIELIELIENYNETYKNTAQKLVDEVLGTGIQELFDKINSLPEYARKNGYVSCGVAGYTGESSRYLDSTDPLGYIVGRIRLFEGE